MAYILAVFSRKQNRRVSPAVQGARTALLYGAFFRSLIVLAIFAFTLGLGEKSMAFS